MGATVINGAKIGNNCLVGAHSLVTEGKEFPDGMLIMGTPAKAVRPVAPEVIESIRKDAVKYAERAKRYANGLRPIA
jgi:carbonic anhydrase/acetyltransferase-like protein (isoleucine patch superfamily)